MAEPEENRDVCSACGQRKFSAHQCGPRQWAGETNRLLNEVLVLLQAILEAGR